MQCNVNPAPPTNICNGLGTVVGPLCSTLGGYIPI